MANGISSYSRIEVKLLRFQDARTVGIPTGIPPSKRWWPWAEGEKKKAKEIWVWEKYASLQDPPMLWNAPSPILANFLRNQ